MIVTKLPPPYYGTSVWGEVLVNSSKWKQYDVEIFDTNSHDSLATLNRGGIKSIYKNLNLYLQLRHHLINTEYDLVLIPFSQSTIGFIKDSIFILLSKLFGRKIILQLHGGNIRNWLNKSSVMNQFYIKKILNSSSGIIVLGDILQKQFQKHFSKDQIFVVPNGADYPLLNNGEMSISSSSDKLEVLYLSNLQPSKGINDVIDSIEIVRKTLQQEIQLNVVGNWRDKRTKKYCQSKRDKLGLPVIFHPPAYNEDKYNHLKSAEIFVFPPREPEGHPWVIVEALAAGLPIISTDQGAITESVIDGWNGFIVEPNNPEQIADKLKTLIEQPGLRKKMGKNSRSHYLNNFTEAHMVENYEKCFNSVLNRSKH